MTTWSLCKGCGLGLRVLDFRASGLRCQGLVVGWGGAVGGGGGW